MANFKASIVLVTYNNVELTRLCLESIYAKSGAPKFEVVVVDNASQDSTPEFLTQFAAVHPAMQVILNETNAGLAKANNQGVQSATGEYLVFLNNDTIVTQGWLAGLIRHLQDPRVGMVGPVTNSSGNESRIPVNYVDITAMDQYARRYTHSHRGQAFEIPMLAFFCVMLRRTIFEQVGPLDERFGIGMFEDDDYALRMKEKGYRILCAEDVFVHHWGNAAFSLIGQQYYDVFLENLQKFESKWARRWFPQLSRREFLPQQLRDLAYHNARLVLQLSERERSLNGLRLEAAEREQLIVALQAQISERNQALAEIQMQIQERVETIDNVKARNRGLRRQLARRDRVVLGLREQIEGTTLVSRELQAERAQKEQAVTALGRQLAHTQELDAQLAEKEQTLVFLNKQLVDIYFSTGWALLQLLWRIRSRFIPHGSWREKWARSALQSFRLARQPRSAQKTGLRPDSMPPPLAEPVNSTAAPTVQHQQLAQSPITVVEENSVKIVEEDHLVSVILPVYNQAAFLRASIESVLTQTYQNLELIVIDDGSTDDVDSVLAGFVDQVKVRILKQKNQTLPKALSNAFEFARGEFWTWTSADNLMQPEQLAVQVSFLQAHPDAAMVYADYLAIDDRGLPLTDPAFRPQNRHSPESPEIHLPRNTETLNKVQDNFIGPCFMYRGWVGRLLGEYAPELGCEDYDYWMRINLLYKIMHLGTDQTLYQYRVHENTLNANARTLNIPERVQGLMSYERERDAFYRRSWTVCVDPWVYTWLRRIETPRRFSIAPLDYAGDGDATNKILFLVHADSLPELAGRQLPPNACVAAWFGSDESAPYVYHTELTECVDVCFASDHGTLARLDLNHRQVFQAAPGADLVDLALAYGNNTLAHRAKYKQADRCRGLPTVYVPAHRQLRVLLQVDNFTQGGLEQAVINLAACLQNEQFQVFLLVLGRQGDSVSKAEQIGVTVLTLPEEDRRVEHYRGLLTEKQIDLVSAHYSLFGAETAAGLNIPFVQTIHNTYIWLSAEQRKFLAECDPCTTAYVCVSHNVAFYSDVCLHLPPTKMVIIPNGIDLRQFDVSSSMAERQRLREELGLKPDDYVFLNVASIYPPKAQRFAVQALSRVLGSRPNAKLVLVGSTLDDDYLGLIKKDIEANGMTQAVVFAGYRENVIPFYWMADAFLLPSFWEGWSLALAEAFCAHLPTVATDVGAARELLGQSSHWIVQPPFVDVTDLDSSNMTTHLEQDHATFVQDLADIMETLCTNPSSLIPPALPGRLDSREAYSSYIHLFRWLIQGGAPISARPWTRQ